MFPGRGFGIKGVQIIETISMGTTATEEIELIAHIAKFHTCSWGWALSFNLNLRPSERRYLKYKEVVEPLGAVPATKNIQVILNNT
jgi:hypothetical protein